MINFGNVDAGSTLYIPFATYGSDGASITLTGLAVTDIEIYKNGSTTQRSSDAGYALLDTDGIDFDSITGLHGFSVDLSDNTDSGFYAAGSQYWVVVSAVTVDSLTVNFIAATFSIGAVSANVTQISGDTQSATDLKDFADAGYDPSTNKVQGVVLVDTVTTLTGHTAQTGDTYALANGASGFVAIKGQTADIEVDTQDLQTQIGTDGAGLTAIPWNAAWDAEVQSECADALTAYDAATGTDISSLQTHGDSTWATATGFSTHSAADVVTALGTGSSLTSLATASALATVDGIVDAILVDTAEIGASGAGLTALPWNAAWDAEVESECNDAIVAYDVPSNTDLVSELSTAIGTINTYVLRLIQLVVRKDAAIATDNSTQLGHINSNMGSGVGDYDNTLESTQAVADAIPTATENADALLNRDMSSVSDTNARTPLNALRRIRNKTEISGNQIVVYKENDSTSAFALDIETDSAAEPIVSVDPTT